MFDTLTIHVPESGSNLYQLPFIPLTQVTRHLQPSVFLSHVTLFATDLVDLQDLDGRVREDGADYLHADGRMGLLPFLASLQVRSLSLLKF